MPFDELYQQDTNSALSAMQFRLDDPAPVRSGWGAPWRAIKAASAEVSASTLDIMKAYGAAAATTYEADPVARVALGDEAIARGAAEGHRMIASGEAMNSVTGGAARRYAETLRPDPVTAGRAEQVVFGVVRPVSKLIAGGFVAGPFGIVGAAGEEGLTTSDELRRKGVDLPTRTAIGGLTAAATAATAFVPLAGSTLKATAGLYVASGPGSYIAQQAATRAILEHANYTDLAKQYDPLDPVGLMVASLVPLPFAAHGAHANVSLNAAADAIARDLAAGRAPDGSVIGVTPETVDATLTHNLTIQADQQSAIHPVEAGQEIAAQISAARTPPARAAGPAPGESTALPPIERGEVPIIKQPGMDMADVDATLAGLPPLQPGYVRLFRGESPTVKFADVFDANALTGHRAPEIPGQRYSDTLSVADYYRSSYGKDATVHYIDVPEAVAERGRVSDDEFKIDLAAVNEARARGVETGVQGEGAAPRDLGPSVETQSSAGAPKRDAAQQLAANRVAQLESAVGDMPVRVDEAGKTASVGDEVARIRREVDEGTDAELGRQDADLLRVAAACAMTLS